MQCPKAGSLVFLGLVMMTAGFVLTLAGWFAPPIKEAVLRVRLAGPVTLLLGLLLLATSCCICAFQQRKCCACCYPQGSTAGGDSSVDIEHTQMSPLLLREMRQAMDKCKDSASTAGRSGRPGGGGAPGRTKRRPHAESNVFNATNNRSPARNLRPTDIFLPRAGIYQQTFYNCDDGSPDGKRKVKVTVMPLTTSRSKCNVTPSPTSPPIGGALTYPQYFRNFKQVVDSSL